MYRVSSDIVEELLNETRYNSRARPQADLGNYQTVDVVKGNVSLNFG